MSRRDEGEPTPRSRPVPGMRPISLRNPLVLVVVTALVAFSGFMETMQSRSGEAAVAAFAGDDTLLVMTAREAPAAGDARPLGTWKVVDAVSGDTRAEGRGQGDLLVLGRDHAFLFGRQGFSRVTFTEEGVRVVGPDHALVDLDLEPLGAASAAGAPRVAGRDRERRGIVVAERSLGAWISRAFHHAPEGHVVRLAAPSADGEVAVTAVIEDASGRPRLESYGLAGTAPQPLHAALDLDARSRALAFSRQGDRPAVLALEGEAGAFRAVTRVVGTDGILREVASRPVDWDGEGAIGALGADAGAGGGLVVLGAGSVIALAPAVAPDGIRVVDADLGGRAAGIAVWLAVLIYAPAILALVLGVLECVRRPMILDPPMGVRPAPLLRRLLAALIDLGLANAAAVAAYALTPAGRDVLEGPFGDATRATPLEEAAPFVAVVFGVFVFLAALCEARFGVTPGKAWCGLRVIAEDGGGRPSILRCLGRRALIYVDLRYVTAILVFLGPRRQRLGDLVSRTLVVDARVAAGEGARERTAR